MFGRFADVLGGKMKIMIVLMNAGAAASALWFTLVCVGVAPQSTASFYISVIVNGLLVSAAMPVYYELAVESVFPIAEGVTTGMVTLLNNIGCLVFLILPYIKDLGKRVPVLPQNIPATCFGIDYLFASCPLSLTIYSCSLLSGNIYIYIYI